MSFLDEILVDRRDLDDYVFCPIRYTLTPQPRLQRRHRSLIKLVKFIIGSFITGIKPLLHDYVTGRTGANPSAYMF